jgi:hypothetical protein
MKMEGARKTETVKVAQASARVAEISIKLCMGCLGLDEKY